MKTSQCLKHAQASDDPDVLRVVRGAGRDTTAVKGGRDAFIARVQKHFSFLTRAMLGEIYDHSASRIVNPVFIVAIWGISRFSTVNDPFGVENTCPSAGLKDKFGGPLDCVLFELSDFMRTFEHDNFGRSIGVEKLPFNGVNYYFTDSFTYALEAYEVTNHNRINDKTFHQNFVNFVKILMSG
jgi:hypothetical protein